MIRSPRALGAALMIACAAALAGCGGGGGHHDPAAAAAVSQTFLAASASSGQRLTSSQSACIGTGVIDAFGAPRAVKYGFLAAGNRPARSLSLMLTPSDAATYADIYLRCADPSSIIKDALLARIAPRTDARRQQLKTCLDKTLTHALLRKALIASASGDDANATLTPLFTACGKLG